MSVVNPPTPTIGENRGDGEADVRNALIALIAEFNGNVDDSNVKAGANLNGSKLLDNSVLATKLETTARRLFPQLVAALVGADHKANFGTFNSGGFGGGKTVSGVKAHGLAAAPALVVMCAGAIATQTPSSSAVAASWDGTVDATNFGWRLTIADGGISNNGVNVYWLAIS